MCAQLVILIAVVCSLGQPPVPPTAPELPKSDEQSDRMDALEEQIADLRAKRDEAEAQRIDTTQADAEIARLQGELDAMRAAYTDETLQPFIPAVQQFTAEFAAFADTLNPVSEMTTEQADQMLGFLYRDLGHPRANGRAQLLTFISIRKLLEEPTLSEHVRARFRSHLMKFHQAGGAQVNSHLMAYLGECLYLTSRPDDESLATARDLINRSQERFKEAGRFRDQEEFHRSSMAAQKLREAEWQITAVTGRESPSAADLSRMSAAAIGEIAQPNGGRSVRSIIVLLREYRRLLREPELKPDIVTLIEADLIKIAQLPPLMGDPEWKYWRLWAECAGMLAKRATAMKEFVENELERLRADGAAKQTAYFKAISHIGRKYR